MNRLIKYLTITAFSTVLAFQSVCHAKKITEKIGGTDTGVASYTSNTHAGAVLVKEAVIFSAYDFDATARYNQAGGVAATSGWINVQDYNDDIQFHVNLTTLASTNLTITWQALLNDITTAPMLIYEKVFTAADTDYGLPVGSDRPKYIRIKGITTGDDTDACTIYMRAEGKRK